MTALPFAVPFAVPFAAPLLSDPPFLRSSGLPLARLKAVHHRGNGPRHLDDSSFV